MELPEVELSFCCCFFEIHGTPTKTHTLGPWFMSPTDWLPRGHFSTGLPEVTTGVVKWTWRRNRQGVLPRLNGTSWQSLASNGSEFMKYSKVRKNMESPKNEVWLIFLCYFEWFFSFHVALCRSERHWCIKRSPNTSVGTFSLIISLKSRISFFFSWTYPHSTSNPPICEGCGSHNENPKTQHLGKGDKADVVEAFAEMFLDSLRIPAMTQSSAIKN